MTLDEAFAALAAHEKRGIRWRVGPSACGGDVYVAHVWRLGNERAPVPIVEPTMVGALARAVNAAERLVETQPTSAQQSLGCGIPSVTRDGRWLLRCGTVTAGGFHLCSACEVLEKR